METTPRGLVQPSIPAGPARTAEPSVDAASILVWGDYCVGDTAKLRQQADFVNSPGQALMRVKVTEYVIASFDTVHVIRIRD